MGEITKNHSGLGGRVKNQCILDSMARVPGMMPRRLVLAATRVLMRMFLSRRGGVSARMPLGQ